MSELSDHLARLPPDLARALAQLIAPPATCEIEEGDERAVYIIKHGKEMHRFTHYYGEESDTSIQEQLAEITQFLDMEYPEATVELGSCFEARDDMLNITRDKECTTISYILKGEYGTRTTIYQHTFPHDIYLGAVQKMMEYISTTLEKYVAENETSEEESDNDEND